MISEINVNVTKCLKYLKCRGVKSTWKLYLSEIMDTELLKFYSIKSPSIWPKTLLISECKKSTALNCN